MYFETLPKPWSKTVFNCLLTSFYLSVQSMFLISIANADQLAWPAVPHESRISFVDEIRTASDTGIEVGKFRKFLRFVLGGEAGEGAILKPISVHVDRQGALYVTDQAVLGVHVFNPNENKYDFIHAAGNKDLLSPVDVEVSASGNVYVSDSQLGEVAVYNRAFKYQFSIKGYFSRPTGLSIKDDLLYVVDTGLHKVLIFDLKGVLQGEFGQRGVEAGQFNYPIFLDTRNNIYINDALNFRLQVLNANYETIGLFGHQGDVQGTFARSKGVGVDSDENIYVSDALFNAFQIFNPQGQLLLVVGSKGRNAGQFQMPGGIHIDENDRIYVADTMNGRIQIFQYHGASE